MTHKPPDHPVGVGKILLALWVFANIGASANAQQQQQQQQLSRDPSLSGSLARGKSTFVEIPNSAAYADEQDPDLPENTVQPNKRKNSDASSEPNDKRADLILYAQEERKLRDSLRAPAKPADPKSDRLSSRLPARSLQDWKIEDMVLLATVDGQIHAASRDTGEEIWHFEAETPMVETQYHGANQSNQDGTVDPLVNNFIWIVEPSQDGALYGYTPGSSVGMQKLGLTVKDLVNDLSGYESDDPPVVYNGEKKTSLYSINIKDGKIIKSYSARGSFVNDPGVCRQKGELDALDDEKCGPISTLTLTRTEYIVGIQSATTGDPICTIKYSEWGANTRDKDLHIQHAKSKDDRYIHSRSNGEIYAVDHKDLRDTGGERELRPTYRKKYSSPVVRVFDIARPTHSTTFDTPLILLPQPVDPVFTLGDNQNVFVNCTEAGSLYALSGAIYPFITGGADPAECARDDWPNTKFQPYFKLKDALVGVHSLSSSRNSPPQVPAIGGSESLTLEGTPRKEVTPNGGDGIIIQGPGSSRVIGFSYTQAVIAVLVICLTGLGAGRILPRASLPSKIPSMPEPTKIDVPLVEPVTPMEDAEPAAVKVVEKAVKFQVDDDKENESPEATLPIEPEGKGQGDEDLDKPKKKAHRGKRGGKREAEKRALKATMQQEEIDGIVEGVKQIGEKNMSVTPDVVYQSSSENQDAPAGLLNLEIQTDQVLGHGSGGTLVFEGKFEGRDVAVKRMLGQYSELASQEVSLLEQSEDHPNVIRYYCRRQDEHFLYIALELCQASLWEIYRDGRRDEVPEKYNTLLAEIDSQPNKVLRQLAEGLKHLHTFRIVHRDIKPQNMLIAYPKKHTTATFPRVVISDFGLCKTLPEGASTLIGATVSAGTIGWKAPELIIQPKDASGVSASNHSTGKDSSNGDFAGAQGIKRSTDIFSLGCVFFYVLTKGLHPYDDEEGWMGIRERNIKSNKCNLEAISIHGPDTVDLIQWMLAPKPEDRPTAAEVLAHPFFWNAEDRLEFLSLTSDRFDMEARDGTSAALARLESYAEEVIGAGPTSLSLSTPSASSRFNVSSANHHRSSSSHSDPNGMSLNIPIPGEPNFLAALDRKFIDTLGKQRKYQGHKVVDLLRALRNKHHHWDDMPDDVKQRVGAVPEGYLRYWEQRFPKLTVSMWRVVKDLGLSNERRYWRWYGARVE